MKLKIFEIVDMLLKHKNNEKFGLLDGFQGEILALCNIGFHLSNKDYVEKSKLHLKYMEKSLIVFS